MSEGGSYLWHRFGAHTDIIPGVHDVHRIHHEADLTHEAHEDFLVVIILLFLLGLFLFILYKSFLPTYYLIMIYLTVVAVFVWNWYIHSAYHIPNHWLNQYDWFKQDKKIHLQHHVDPTVNYGIASHFSDIIFGTYIYPFKKIEPKVLPHKQ